ncbi:transposase [Rhodococcus sp. HNM0563]
MSSRHLRRDHAEHLSRYLWGGHLWSRSYCCGTAGGARCRW